MRHFRSSVIAITLATFTTAQDQYRIDPNNVDPKTRDAWCLGQTTQCPLICLQLPGVAGANSNECDPTTLTYSCVCTNGQTPNVSEYSQTLPYFICTEWGRECVSNCGSDSACAADCRDKHPCGAQNPKRVNLTTATPTVAASKTGLASATAANVEVYSGLAGATATGAASNLQPIALSIGQAYGISIVAGGLFAGFALLL